MSRPRHLVVAVLALSAIVLNAAAASAQDRQRGGGFGGRMGGQTAEGSKVGLLGMETVQKELKLSADQTATVQKMAGEMRSQMQETFSGLQDLSAEERREKMTEMRAEMAKMSKAAYAKADALLNPEQRERLNQLSLQQRGTAGLSDPETATALKLSDEQKQKLKALAEAAQEQRRAAFQAAGGGGGGGGRERFAAMQKEQDEKAMQVLSAEQRDQFEKMKGKKFEFPERGGQGRRQPGA
ncbi:MAG: hypothetical protein HYX69_23405 [Planctomycetia bacterium]|nr:hypothetical protein [Planctomycetia bacterium]